MKQCKTGPCVVFMPDKSRYTGVAPKEVSTLVEKHFAAKLKPVERESQLSTVK
jgi:(2Fe-2S) ferredoxin